MTEEISADKLVAAYIKMRDRRAELLREYEDIRARVEFTLYVGRVEPFEADEYDWNILWIEGSDWVDRDKRRLYIVHAEQNALRYVKPDECALIAVTFSTATPENRRRRSNCPRLFWLG